MKVICPKCQAENQLQTTPYSPTRIPCARCASMIEVRLGQELKKDQGAGQTAPPPLAARTSRDQLFTHQGDPYATQLDPELDEILDIPRIPYSSSSSNVQTPVFEDVFATPAYPPEATEAVIAPAPETRAEDSPRANGRYSPPDPQPMSWPVLPEDSFEFRRSPGKGRSSNLFLRVSLIGLLFSGLGFLAWYFLGDLFIQRNQVASAPPHTAHSPGSSAPKASVDTPASKPEAESKQPTALPQTASPSSKGERIDIPVPESQTSPKGHAVNQSEGSLTLQVGSFPDAAEANRRVERLKAAGITARVVTAQLPGRGTWHRVQIGRFVTREEADRYGKQLRAKGDIQDFIVTGYQQ